MLDANYQRHFKVLGKLAYLYDYTGSETTELEDLLAITEDQRATGDEADNPFLVVMSGLPVEFNSAIVSGSAAHQTIAQRYAGIYLTNAAFTSGLTTVPANSSVGGVLAALQTDMGAGVDNKTLGTKAATGLVNFFDSMLAAPGTWNTESDATADYRDAIYVIDTKV